MKEPPQLSRYRARQSATSKGPGSHFTSPQKRVPARKSQQKAIPFLDLENRRHRLQKELDQLLLASAIGCSVSDPASISPSVRMDVDPVSIPCDNDDQWEDVIHDASVPNQAPNDSAAIKVPTKKKCLTPDEATISLYAKWQALLPTLVEPLLAYTSDSVGKVSQPVREDLVCACNHGPSCETKQTSILCLYFDRTFHHNYLAISNLIDGFGCRFYYCECETLFMPASHQDPHTPWLVSNSSRAS